MSSLDEFVSGAFEMAEEARNDPRVPIPTGYQVLLMPIKMEEKTSGGIIIPEESRAVRDIAGICFYVLSMGDEAYSRIIGNDYEPYCRVDDFVVLHAYTGTRLIVDRVEYRLVNDDSIKAVVIDPRGVKRAE